MAKFISSANLVTGSTVPPPFNMIPTLKGLKRLLCCGKRIERIPSMKVLEKNKQILIRLISILLKSFVKL